MLQSVVNLLYVDSNRVQGEKNGRDYDFATVELSDGIASFELPLDPLSQPSIKSSFFRGDKVVITVDAKKNFGKYQLIVSKVEAKK